MKLSLQFTFLSFVVCYFRINFCSDSVEDDENLVSDGFKAKKYNFASYQSGAELIDYSPKNGKGFKHLISDDRDKYAIFSCSDPKKWVVIGLSEEIVIESVAIASNERYSAIIKDFQLLTSVSYPTNNWINLGNFTYDPILGEQVFPVAVDPNTHTRFLRVKIYSHHFNEDICTVSQIKVYGKTIYETLKTGVEDMLKETTNESISDEENKAAALVPVGTVGAEGLRDTRLPAVSDSSETSVIEERPALGTSAAVLSSASPVQTSPELQNSENEQVAVIVESEIIPSVLNSDIIAAHFTSESSEKSESVQNETVPAFSPASINHHHFDSSPQALIQPSNSFNDFEMNLINETLTRSNVSEAYYQKAMRRITAFFSHSLQTTGVRHPVNQSSLESLLITIKPDEDDAVTREKNSHSHQLTRSVDSSSADSTTELQQVEHMKVTDQLENHDVTADNVTVSSPGLVCSSPCFELNNTKDRVIEKDIIVEEHAHLTSASPAEENYSAPLVDSAHVNHSSIPVVDIHPPVDTETGTTTTADDDVSSKPLEKTDAQSGFIHEDASFLELEEHSLSVKNIPEAVPMVSNEDCLSILKFSDFRKKRRKDDSNGAVDDKANVIKTLFSRLKFIEANEEIIGQFFDEVSWFLVC
jgi:hypothetical protein